MADNRSMRLLIAITVAMAVVGFAVLFSELARRGDRGAIGMERLVTRGCPGERVRPGRPQVDRVDQHQPGERVDHAGRGHLARQPVGERPSRERAGVQGQRRDDARLSGAQEGQQLGRVGGVLAVVVAPTAITGESEPVSISLVYMADLHAQLEPHAERFWHEGKDETATAGGIARIATAAGGGTRVRDGGGT